LTFTHPLHNGILEVGLQSHLLIWIVVTTKSCFLVGLKSDKSVQHQILARKLFLFCIDKP